MKDNKFQKNDIHKIEKRKEEIYEKHHNCIM
jgi:hypothetical protein